MLLASWDQNKIYCWRGLSSRRYHSPWPDQFEICCRRHILVRAQKVQRQWFGTQRDRISFNVDCWIVSLHWRRALLSVGFRYFKTRALNLNYRVKIWVYAAVVAVVGFYRRRIDCRFDAPCYTVNSNTSQVGVLTRDPLLSAYGLQRSYLRREVCIISTISVCNLSDISGQQ